MSTVDIVSLEAFINYANSSAGGADLQCMEIINQLRASPDRWSVGLRLFFESTGSVARFFGLSLVRDFLSLASRKDPEVDIQVCQHIRESMFRFVHSVLDQSNTGLQLDRYIVNNLISILALCIVLEYPDRWPSAVDDLLALGSGENNVNGLTFVVAVLSELNLEIVEFNSERSSHELQRNMAVKDRIRETVTADSLVQFLCATAMGARQFGAPDLSSASLRALAQFIGWFNVQLVVEKALPTIYQCIGDDYVGGAAAYCLFELVKKGMDPELKIQLVSSIGLVPAILSIQIQDDGSGGLMEDSKNPAQELGPVVDILVQELLGVCAHDNASEIGLIAADMLRALMPQLMILFSHSNNDVSSTVVDSLNKLVSILKAQASQLQSLLQSRSLNPRIFIAEDFLSDILTNIYRQMHYPPDFAFDADDEDDAEVIEYKKSVRTLFINICRVRPEQSMRLIAAAFSSIAQPLSTAPFPSIEAALRLLLSFSDCGGNIINAMMNGELFLSILSALYLSDISQHPHDQVVQVYYEVCCRYARQTSDESVIQRIAESMLGATGIGNSSSQLRQRSAYLFQKFVDGLGGNAKVLLPYVSGISILLISDMTTQHHQLTEQSELYLLESIGILTSHHVLSSEGNETTISAYRDQQERLVIEIAAHLQSQISSIRNHTDKAQFEADLAALLAHKMSSIAAISKRHSYAVQTTSSKALFSSAVEVSGAINEFAMYPSVRARGVVFMHRMITAIGPATLGPIQECLARLLSYSDSKDTDTTIQLLNQCMIEFSDQVLDLIDAAFSTIFEKCKVLFSALEQNLLVAPPDDDEDQSDGVPRFELERVTIVKQFLVFIQHIAQNQCHAALSLSRYQNGTLLQSVLQIVLSGLRGEVSLHFTETPWTLSSETTIPLRKSAVLILTALVKEWAPNAVGRGPIISQRGGVPLELSQALTEVLYHEVLPYCLILCRNNRETMNGVGFLDLHDAQSLSLVSEIGGFFWTVAEVRGCQEISSWLSGIYHSVGWSVESAAELSRQLGLRTPLGTFKENFKNLVVGKSTG